LLAARKGYAIPGILTVLFVSSVGGGLLRDGLFLQNGPPMVVRTPGYLGLIGAAVVVILVMGGRIQRLRHLPLGNPTRMPLDLPGKPIVVPDAPHHQLIERATLMISHAGLNTTLTSLGCGVPVLAIPITNEQPGIAARLVLPILRTLPLNARQGDWGQWPWWMTSTLLNSAMAEAPTPPLQRRLQADLSQLARPRHAQWNPLGLLAVRHLVQERMRGLGELEEHAFGQGTSRGVNLILRLPGRQPRLSPLLVGAHYDGPPQSPGADDNATGMAVLLELARRWSEERPRRPIWLVAFDQEEEGLLGSRALATELRARGQAIHLMVSLEMLGYTSPHQRYPLDAMRWLYGTRGNFLALVANGRSLPLLPGLARRLGRHVSTKVLPVPLRGRPLPDTRRSDHSPFWDQGYNALMATDTSFLRNPHYNQPSDTLATLDMPFLTRVCEGLHAALDPL
jgi:hypothetical protein